MKLKNTKIAWVKLDENYDILLVFWTVCLKISKIKSKQLASNNLHACDFVFWYFTSKTMKNLNKISYIKSSFRSDEFHYILEFSAIKEMKYCLRPNIFKFSELIQIIRKLYLNMYFKYFWCLFPLVVSLLILYIISVKSQFLLSFSCLAMYVYFLYFHLIILLIIKPFSCNW